MKLYKHKLIICIMTSLMVLTANMAACNSLSQNTVSHKIVPPVFEGSFTGGMVKSQPTLVDLVIEFPKVPDELTAYEVIKPNIDDNYARDMAQRLGFVNEWPLYGGERVAYSFTKDDQSLEINLEGEITFRGKREYAISPQIPDDEECIKIAKNWLLAKDLYPSNVSRVKTGYLESGGTVDQQTGKPGITVQYSKNIAFIPGIGDYDGFALGAHVEVGDGGNIVGASIVDPNYQVYSSVKLKTPQAALEVLKMYMARLTPIAEEAPECMYNTDGTRVAINKISIQYIKTYKTGYILPIYVFEGDAFTAGNSASQRFIGEVDAVNRQNK